MSEHAAKKLWNAKKNKDELERRKQRNRRKQKKVFVCRRRDGFRSPVVCFIFIHSFFQAFNRQPERRVTG